MDKTNVWYGHLVFASVCYVADECRGSFTSTRVSWLVEDVVQGAFQFPMRLVRRTYRRDTKSRREGGDMTGSPRNVDQPLSPNYLEREYFLILLSVK